MCLIVDDYNMSSIFQWVSETVRSVIINSKKSRLLKWYEKGRYDKMASLFKNQQDYAKITFDQFPFIYYLISEGNVKAVQTFIKSIKFQEFIKHDEANPFKTNPIVFAYLEDKIQIIEFLEKEGFDVSLPNSEGQNILHLSAIYRRNNSFNLAIKKINNIDSQDIFGNTPLHYSCRVGQVSMIESLLAGRAKRIMNKNYQFPIHMAVQSGKIEAVRLIYDDLFKSYPQYHPIHSAARSGLVQVAKEMIKRQLTLVNQVDYKRMTPLHHAVALENIEMVNFLTQRPGILIDSVDQFGNTPLHIAFINNRLDVIRTLVEAKADLDILNNDYLAPVDYGIDNNNSQVINYLQSLRSRSVRLSDWVK